MQRHNYIYIIVINLVILLHFSGLAQGEWNNWCFGFQANINFNGGPPANSPTLSAINSLEGCASISDAAGILLFYTNGSNVWAANHTLMPNGVGLLGNALASQSCIIVPAPGSTSLFYIFTVPDYVINTNGARYTIVDMSQNGGLGVVTATKNVLIQTPTCESITAVKHANATDFWIIVKEFNANNILTYQLTPAGLSNTPIVSNFPTTSIQYGYFRANAQGTKVALANYGSIPGTVVYDFDNSTGQLTNGMNLPFGGYGVEFSPNGQLLYTSLYEIHQLNLSLSNVAAITAAAVQIATNDYFLNAIQLGPDNKIYVCRKDSNFIGRINFPNIFGPGCSYTPNFLTLGSGAFCRSGFPNFVHYTINNYQIQFADTCAGDSTHFTLLNPSNLDSVKWNFNDPASGSANFSNLISPAHFYANVGTYNITLTIYRNGGSQVLQAVVHILPVPILTLGNDTIMCFGDTIPFTVNSPFFEYEWSTGSIDSIELATATGNYWMQANSGCGNNRDSVYIEVIQPPLVNLGKDTVLCKNDTLQLDVTWPNASYLWQNGANVPTFEVATAGTYSVEVENSCGLDADTILFTSDSIPNVDLDSIIYECEGVSVTLSGSQNHGNNLWNTGVTSTSIVVNQSGTYWVRASNFCGSATDTATVVFQPTPAVKLGNDTTICYGDDILVELDSTQNFSFIWSTGDTASSVIVQSPQLLQVTVTTSAGCTGQGEKEFFNCSGTYYIPGSFSPNGDGINDYFTIVSDDFKYFEMTIYNRYGEAIYFTYDKSVGWNGKYNGKYVSQDVYPFQFKYTLDGKNELFTVTGYITVVK